MAVIRVDLDEGTPTPGSSRRGGDIIITVNVPLGQASAIDKDELGAPQLSSDIRQLELQAKQAFQDAIHDFKIVDYGLFA